MGVVSTTALSCGPAHQVWSPFGFPTPSRPPSFGRPVRSDRTDANTSHPPWNPNTTGFWLRKTNMVETSVFSQRVQASTNECTRFLLMPRRTISLHALLSLGPPSSHLPTLSIPKLHFWRLFRKVTLQIEVRNL